MNKKLKYFSIDQLSINEIFNDLVDFGFIPKESKIDDDSKSKEIFVPKLEADSPWSAVNEICSVGMYRAFCDEAGRLNIKRDLPSEGYKSIIILPKNIIEIKGKEKKYTNRLENFYLKMIAKLVII